MTAAFDLQTMLRTFEEGSENKIQQIPAFVNKKLSHLANKKVSQL